MTNSIISTNLEHNDDLPVTRTVIFDIDWQIGLDVYVYQASDSEWIVIPKHRYMATRARSIMMHTVDLPPDAIVVEVDLYEDGDAYIHCLFLKESAIG